MTRADFYETVCMLCERFDASMTSGLRSKKRNSAVGGHANSRHRLGLGLDVVPDRREDWEPMASEARRQGLVAVVEDDHIHLQTN